MRSSETQLWSVDCEDPPSPRIILGSKSMSVSIKVGVEVELVYVNARAYLIFQHYAAYLAHPPPPLCQAKPYLAWCVAGPV